MLNHAQETSREHNQKMEYMSKSKLVILFILILSKTGFSQQNSNLLDTLSKFVKQNGYPGAMISIVKSDTTVFVGGIGYADRVSKTPVSKTQLFRQGSISKSFTALALVKLLSEKGISLDTPIEKIDSSIPFKNKWSANAPITVANILEHSTGFDDFHTHAMYATEASQPLMHEYVEAHKNSLYARWKPNTRHAYSNSAYVVAGHLIEVLSNQAYSEYIKLNILDPLGMKASGFYFKKPDLPFVQGYDEQLKPAPYVSIKGGPAGDFCSNAEEMAIFLQFMLNQDGYLIDSTIFTKATFNRIENAQTTLAARNGLSVGYGLGNFGVYQKGFVFHGHNGGIEGFSSRYIYSKEADLGIAVAVNRLKDPTPIVELILDILIKESMNKPRKTAGIPKELIKEFSGFYVFRNPRQQLKAFLSGFAQNFKLEFKEDKGYIKDIFGGIRDSITYAGNNLFYRNIQDVPTVVLMKTAEGKTAIGIKRNYAEKESFALRMTYNILVLLSIILLFVYMGYFGIWFLIQVLKKKKLRLLDRGILLLGCLSFPSWFFSLGSVLSNRATSGEFSFWSVMVYIIPILMIVLSLLTIYRILRLQENTIFKKYYILTSISLLIVLLFLWNSGFIGLKLWSY